MPDNPFEHKAKQKLDELSFTPSDAVWQKVEAQIKKDKDRRRLLIWLPLLGLLLGAGGWYFISVKSKPLPGKETIAIHYKDKSKADSFSVQHIPLKAEASGAIEINKPGQVSGENNKAGAAPEENKKTYANQERIPRSGIRFSNKQEEKTYSARIPGQRETPDIYSTNAGSIAAATSTDSVSGNTENNTPDSILYNSVPVNAGNNKPDLASANPATGNKPDSVDKKAAAAFSLVHEDSLKTTARKTTAPGKKNKIKWGITAGPGLSSVSEKFIQDSYLYSAPSAAPPAAGRPGLPSEKQSFAYFAGLQLQKPLNKTTSVFTGMRYAYSGIKITRGNPVNLPLTVYVSNYYAASVSNYYSAVPSGRSNYTSHYHFLEIPLGIEKQLGQKSRFSVTAGLSVTRLLATNALQFDPQSRIYYKDDSHFNKTQWNILGGIQYSLISKEKYSLRIGPQVQYGLTSLLNKKSPYSEHLFFGGIQLLLLSNRK